MIGCLSDGYILVADGPYFADGNNNDAIILKLMLKNPVLLSFFQPGDYVVVDRGFRDVVDKKSHGIEVYMPNLLKHGKQQFTSSESNESRKKGLSEPNICLDIREKKYGFASTAKSTEWPESRDASALIKPVPEHWVAAATAHP
ncbi:hypothetical protein ILUMI_03731 [Ignelater luminosus]|uniref:DDE Tnp4 domain-containing protein n=1 Tax=Ignelater luminosus TaxID=2038154 RepID=A0A8K0DL71_IGNLU|nr:hypothetical protein ILUMI_03731 [Ignelater luminosus]